MTNEDALSLGLKMFKAFSCSFESEKHPSCAYEIRGFTRQDNLIIRSGSSFEACFKQVTDKHEVIV